MDIFKRRKSELPPLISDEELVDYNAVLNYLVGLSDADYKKVLQVADIYRKADQDASTALGVDREITTFIHPPEEPETDEIPFIIDHPKPKSKKAKNGKA